jgi:hypothetical protein
MSYGYPVQQQSGVGPTVRYAGTLLLIFGVIALLAGGCFAGFGVAWERLVAMPEIQNNAEMQKALSDMRKVGFNLPLALIIFGGTILAYSLTSIVLSIFLIRATGKASVIVGIVLVSIVMVIGLLLIVLQIIGGGYAGAGVLVVFLALHGLILMWLVQALQSPVPATPFMPPTPYPPGYGQPMQGYQYPQNPDKR